MVWRATSAVAGDHGPLAVALADRDHAERDVGVGCQIVELDAPRGEPGGGEQAEGVPAEGGQQHGLVAEGGHRRRGVGRGTARCHVDTPGLHLLTRNGEFTHLLDDVDGREADTHHRNHRERLLAGRVRSQAIAHTRNGASTT